MAENLTTEERLALIEKALFAIADHRWRKDAGETGPYYDTSTICNRCRAEPPPMQRGFGWRDTSHDGDCFYAPLVTLASCPLNPSADGDSNG